MRFLPLLVLAVAGCGGEPRRDASPTAPPQSEAPIAPDPAAVEILAKSAEAYRQVRTYRDEIVIVSDGRGLKPGQAIGRTAFERGGRFLFEVSSKDPYGEGRARSCVWIADNKSFVFTSISGRVEDDKPLRDALTSILADSADASTIVPSLLFPDEFDGETFFDQIESPQLSEELALGTAIYYRIAFGGGRFLLIDKETLLIKRVTFPGGMIDYTAFAEIELGDIDFYVSPR